MNLIVNVDSNWAIGHQGKLLVTIPEDMKFFRSETSGKVVVLGRKTLDTFPGGQPFKNRTNIILSHNPDYKVKGAIVCHSVEEVLEELTKAPEDGEQKMLCTIIEKHGSAPRSAGTQMVVTSLGRVVGTIGGGCAEAEVIMACRKHFYKIREGVSHPACEKIRIRMTTDNAEEEGMVCGGTILVLLEETDDLS